MVAKMNLTTCGNHVDCQKNILFEPRNSKYLPGVSFVLGSRSRHQMTVFLACVHLFGARFGKEALFKPEAY